MSVAPMSAASASFERVVGLGLCVVDHLFEVDTFSFDATRTRYGDRLECPGGMVTTALAQVAALGVSKRKAART